MCLVTGCPDNSQLLSTKDLKFCIKHAVKISDEDLLNGIKGVSATLGGESVSASSPDLDTDEEAVLKVDEEEEEEEEDEEEEEEEEEDTLADGVAGVKIESSGQEDDLTSSPPSSPEPKPKKKNSKKQEKRTRRANKQSSEKRKEKSRDAARCRRSKESKLYSALSDCLPLPQDVLAHLDKASIMRLAIACLNTTNMVAKGLRVRHVCSSPEAAEPCCDDLALRDVCDGGPYQEALLQAVDGFVLVLSTSGDVAFVSTTIANYLGLAQVDVMGASLYDLVHQCDHEDLRQLLATVASPQTSSQRSSAGRRSSSSSGGGSRGGDGARKGPTRRSRSTVATSGSAKLQALTAEANRPSDEEENEEEADGGEYCEPRHGFIRMKCTLANRGRNVTIRNASYKVVEISGKMVLSRAPRTSGLTALGWLICVASPVPHPANIEVPLDKTTYFSKHSLDMKFTYADENFPQFCGFLPRQLVGQSLFQLHHELDGPLLRKSFLTLRAKGQVSTGQYRFLAAGGGYVWLVTQATVIHAPRDSSPAAIVCLHYVISGVECPGQVLSCIQLVGGSPRPPHLASAVCSPRTGGGVGFCGSSSSVGGPADARQQQPSSATHQDMLLIPPNTKDKTNTAKTLQQQKTTGGRVGGGGGGRVLAGVGHGVARSIPPAPALLSCSSAPAPRQQQLVRKAAGEQTTTPRPETACGVAQPAKHDLIKKQSSNSTITANNVNVKIDSAATVPAIRIDTSFMIIDKNQHQPENDDIKPLSASVSPFSSDGHSNSPSPEPVLLSGRSSSPSLGWTACGLSTSAPLLSQTAAGLFCPQERPTPSPPQEQFVSSTASLFETSLPNSDQLGPHGDALALDRYLFTEGEAGTGSSTSDLFSDIDPSQLNLGGNTSLSQDMDIIDGNALFKNEPFCDTEDFDARAPFLPLCEDENLIMWSPSLELDGEPGSEDSAPDYGSNSSGISSSPGSCGSNSHSPVRQTSGDSGDIVYGPDGYLMSSAASTPEEHTLLKREEDAPGSLLAELLQQTATDCRPSDSQPPAACIDPNKVWPGHNRTPQPAPPPEDEEMFELERFLQEDDIQDFAPSVRSPTLASASLNTVNLTFTPSPASPSPSSSSLSPALSSITTFSCNTSSPTCSPLTPDPHLSTKRRSSPPHSPQMSRKRLCSPHVEDSQLQQHQKSSPQRDSLKSGRKLQMPNAPYMQQLLSPRENERGMNAEACKGRLLVNRNGGNSRRLVALPKGMTLVPRVQMIQSRPPPPPPPTLYRVVTAEQAAPRPPDTQLLPISNRGRTLLIRGSAQEKDPGSSFVTTRNLKPVRLVNERNVMEYVCHEEEAFCEQQKVVGSPDCIYSPDDSIEWVEVLEDGTGGIENGASCSPLLKEAPGNKLNFGGQMVGNGRNDRCTETAKCLLLPQQEYSPVTMFRLTQSDYDVNAPAPSDLLRGQELLEALDKTLQ